MHAVPRSPLLLTIFLFLTIIPTTVFAQCTATDPGVRICSPSPNSSVIYQPEIDYNLSAPFGAEIVKWIIYDNNRKIEQSPSGQASGGTSPSGGSEGELFDSDIKNGLHHIVINAWDSNGKLYQGSVSFTVVGDGYPTPCSAPTSPGVNFCSPPANAILGSSYTVSATATGNSKIVAMRLYVDNKAQVTQTNNSNQLTTAASVGTQGNHTVTFVAWDSGGHAFRSSRVINSAYTYSIVGCIDKGTPPCMPGFDSDASMPAANSYVGNSFTIMANILNNPNQITAMKAYIDNTVFAVSNGPTMSSPVENAPNGTHILTLQAWDTKGLVYRYRYNININVPH
jgi:hypothetical protein